MKSFKEIFRKKRSGGEKSSLSFGHGPEADWKLILVSTIVLVVFVSICNLVIFLRINREVLVVENGVGETEATLDLNRLKSTLRYYQNKEVEFEKIKAGAVPSVIDPSL